MARFWFHFPFLKHSKENQMIKTQVFSRSSLVGTGDKSPDCHTRGPWFKSRLRRDQLNWWSLQCRVVMVKFSCKWEPESPHASEDFQKCWDLNQGPLVWQSGLFLNLCFPSKISLSNYPPPTTTTTTRRTRHGAFIELPLYQRSKNHFLADTLYIIQEWE